MLRRDEAGLTLVEMLVVLAIIGVVGAAVALSLGNTGRADGAQAEARRFSRVMGVAGDEALISDRRIALQFDGHGYAFVQWNEVRRDWEAHPRSNLGARHELEAGTELSGGGDRSPLPLDESTGPAVFTFREGEQLWRVAFDGLTVAAEPATRG